MGGFMIFIIVLVIILVLLALCVVRIVPQAYAMVIERLGGYLTTWNVGIHFKVPILDRVAKKVLLKEQVVDFAPQPVITKDNVTMRIDTVVFFQITDPKLFVYGVDNPIMAIENLTATTLRNIIGDLELDETLTSRETINTKMRASLDVATDPWGIKVNRVELKNIIPPQAIQDAMEKQMKAERERREAVTRAEGEKKASITIAEGKREAAILEAEADKQSAILRAEAEKEKMIRKTKLHGTTEKDYLYEATVIDPKIKNLKNQIKLLKYRLTGEKQKKEKRQIDTLIKYDRAKICPKCGELMRYAFGEVFKCDNCGAEELTSFGKVRKYIEDHGPSNAANISDGTGVPVSTINRYLREGRIEIPDGSDSYIKCEDCGAEIRYGRYCPACAAKHNKGQNVGIFNSEAGEVPKHKRDAYGKMHTLDVMEKTRNKR